VRLLALFAKLNRFVFKNRFGACQNTVVDSGYLLPSVTQTTLLRASLTIR
jgi:hypothetical protein